MTKAPATVQRLDKNETVVLECITNAANRGDLCPSNSLLACALGVESIGTPPNILKRLEEKGIISVERFQTSRVVTILQTGKVTATPRCVKKHWRRRKDRTRFQTMDVLADKLADGLEFYEAARAADVSPSYARLLFLEMRRPMGAQAA